MRQSKKIFLCDNPNCRTRIPVSEKYNFCSDCWADYVNASNCVDCTETDCGGPQSACPYSGGYSKSAMMTAVIIAKIKGKTAEAEKFQEAVERLRAL